MTADSEGSGAVILYSRRNCPLCFAVGRSAARAARRHKVALVVVDIDSDPRLQSLYDAQVPVLVLPHGETRHGGISAPEVDEAFRRARGGR